MKQRTLWRLCLWFVLMLPVAVHAQYEYITLEGKIIITRYTGADGAVVIPSSIDGMQVRYISQQAFAYRNLTSVVFPDSIVQIDNAAFFGCTNLTSLTIPDSVIRIDNEAFGDCSGLTNVTFGKNLAVIGLQVFQGCRSLVNAAIPNSVTSIGIGAFSGCSSLASVTIQNSVTSIGNGAFSGCSSLGAITVDALNHLYSSVDGILFNKGRTTLIQYPGGKAGSYVIPDGVITIGEAALSSSPSLTSVKIPSSVTSVGNYAFSGCRMLSSVTLENKVASIGWLAFFGCSSLANITIPNSVTSIGNNAFSGCASLTSVTIPGSVTYIGSPTFSACTNLSAITVDPFNTSYSSIDGVLFDKSETTLLEYPGGKAGNYRIPTNTTGISVYAFFRCSGITNVTIPNTVTRIRSEAFSNCPNLTEVYFEGNAPRLDNLRVLHDSDQVTVHYLPETMGWEATFAQRPTALWNPQALTSDGNFGVRANQFGFTISWASDKIVVVDAATDLSDPVWTPVGTNTLTGGSSYFSDPQWTEYPTRLYRVRPQ